MQTKKQRLGNPMKDLVKAIAKASAQDLLATSDEQPSASILEQRFELALAPLSPSADHFHLLSALFKRCTSLLAALPLPTSQDLISENCQLQVLERVRFGLDSGERNVASAATTALESYVAFARALGRLRSEDEEEEMAVDGQVGHLEQGTLLPMVEPLLQSPDQLDKSSAIILATVLPSLPLNITPHYLCARLLYSKSPRDAVHGRLLATCLSAHLSTAETASSMATLLLTYLLDASDSSRRSLLNFTLRPLAASHPTFLCLLTNTLHSSPAFASHPTKDATWASLASFSNSFSLCDDIRPFPLIAAAESRPPTPSSFPSSLNLVQLPQELLLQCLSAPAYPVRLAVLSVIADRPSLVQPLSQLELDLLVDFFQTSFNAGDNDFRHSIVGRTSKLLLRLKNSTFASRRDLAKLEAQTAPLEQDLPRQQALADDLTRAKAFLDWLIAHILSHLEPSNSYAPTILALRLLSTLFDSGIFVDVLSSSSPSPASASDSTSSAKGKGKSKTSTAGTDWIWTDLRFFSDNEKEVNAKRLLKCLMWTFVDVRTSAVELLERASVPLSAAILAQLEREAMATFLSNPRGTESHTGALARRLFFRARLTDPPAYQAEYIQGILGEIERRLEASKDDIARSVSSGTVHGHLQALLEIFPRVSLEPTAVWRPVLERTLRLVQLAWACTREILSSASALSAGGEGEDEDGDGLVPDHEEARALEVAAKGEVVENDGKEEEKGEGWAKGVRHQMILSWAWRTVKEASALLSTTLCLALPSSSPPTATQLASVGSTFSALLSEIRHPGAFLAIYPRYRDLVAAVVRAGDTMGEEVRDLPGAWLKVHLSALNVSHHTAGRRSAGLPYAVLAVVLGAPRLTPQAVDALFVMARSATAEVKVTALNTLKVVLMDATLAGVFPVYLEQGIITGMSCMGSDDWAVRNVGLLLIGALIKRAFAPTSHLPLRSRECLPAWFARFPRLKDVFLDELNVFSTAGQERGEGAAFAVLQVLGNLRASDESSPSQDAFLLLLEALGSSRQLDIREAAANALPAVLSGSEADEYTSRTLASLVDPTSLRPRANAHHGQALRLHVLLKDVVTDTFVFKPAELASLESVVAIALGHDGKEPTAPIIQAVFVQALTAFSQRVALISDLGSFGSLSPANTQISAVLHSRGTISAQPGTDLLLLACARYVLRSSIPVHAAVLDGFSEDEVSSIALEHWLVHPPADKASVALVTHAATRWAFRPQARMLVREPALRWLASPPASGERIGASEEQWEALFGEVGASKCEPFREAALPVLGRLVRQDGFGEALPRAMRLLDRLGPLIDPNQLVSTRASALATFELLSPIFLFMPPFIPASVTYSSRLRAQALLLNLLQDDDPLLRTRASALVGTLLSLREGGLHQAHALARWWDLILSEARGEDGRLKEGYVRWAVERAVEPSAIDLLDTATSPTSVLFAVEPPNRYLEPRVDLLRILASLPSSPSLSFGSAADETSERIREAAGRLAGIAQRTLVGGGQDDCPTLLLDPFEIARSECTLRSGILERAGLTA